MVYRIVRKGKLRQLIDLLEAFKRFKKIITEVPPSVSFFVCSSNNNNLMCERNLKFS